MVSNIFSVIIKEKGVSDIWGRDFVFDWQQLTREAKFAVSVNFAHKLKNVNDFKVKGTHLDERYFWR